MSALHKNLKIINLKETNKRDGIVVSFFNNKPNSYFKDHNWVYHDLKNKNSEVVNINFFKLYNKKINNLELLKEIAYLEIVHKQKKPSTVKIITRNLSEFFSFITDNFEVRNINEINKTHSEAYLDFILKQNISFSTAKNKLSPIRSVLYESNQELSWGYKEDPFSGAIINNLLKKEPNIKDVKQTEIIPEEKWKSIINVCTKYIEDYEKLFDKEDLIHKEYIYHSEGNGFSLKYFNKKYKHFKKWGYPYRTRLEHDLFLNNVSISASILIQAFTGMRESELYSLTNDCLFLDDDIMKVKGLTFKYEDANLVTGDSGRKVDWICPDIVCRAINCLLQKNKNAIYQFKKYHTNGEESKNKISYLEAQNILFINNYSSDCRTPVISRNTSKYDDFIKEHGIELSFKITSHCFRRTLARFFAKSLLDMPVDILKEQFKHFSKEITNYYMKEDSNSDGDFINLIEGYKDNCNESHFKEVKDKIIYSIENANNVKELKLFIGENKLNIVNDYMAKIENEEPLSPLECLTCKGVILLPDLHLSYWVDMLSLYDELLKTEPNSKWFKLEREQIFTIVQKLQKNEAYIVE